MSHFVQFTAITLLTVTSKKFYTFYVQVHNYKTPYNVNVAPPLAHMSVVSLSSVVAREMVPVLTSIENTPATGRCLC